MWTVLIVLFLTIVLPVLYVILFAIYQFECESKILERAKVNFDKFGDPYRHQRTIRSIVRYEDNETKFLSETKDDKDFLFHISIFESRIIMRLRRMYSVYSFIMGKYMFGLVLVVIFLVYQLLFVR